MFHPLCSSFCVCFSSHFMLECSFISPALAVVIVPLALLTVDCFVNYVSMLPASIYGHDIVTQVRSLCHLLPDVMETLMMTAAEVKRMFSIFSSLLMSFVFISSVSLLLGCSCYGAVDCSAVSLTSQYKQIPCSLMRAWLSWIQ